MKKGVKRLLIVLLVLLMATTAVFAASGAINAIITPKDGLTVIPYDASNTEISSSGSILNPEYFKVTYENQNILEGEQYVIIVAAADLSGADPVYDVTESSVKYIDQKVGAAGSVVFDKVYPSEICDAVILISGVGLESPEIVATIKANEESSEPRCTLMGASLRLTGDIGINFYYELSDEALNDPSTKVSIKVGNGEEQILHVSDAVIDTTTIQGSTLYKFTVFVAAKQMKDEIRFHIESGSFVDKERIYSVRKYADRALSDSANEKLKYLVRVMMHYGSAAQTYLNYNLENPADEGLDNSDVLAVCNALKASDLEAYKTQRTDMPDDGISIYAANLSLESETVLRYHFELAEGHSIDEYTFTVDGKKCDPVLINGRYCVEIRNILAKDIDKMFTVVVTNQEGKTGSISYGILSYVRSALRLEGTDNEKPALSAVGRSLYAYNLASKDYLGG